MNYTDVYLLVPTYSGTTGTIRAAYELASQVQPDGPIRFHLKDYPEEDPKGYMRHDEEWDGMNDIIPKASFSYSLQIEEPSPSLAYARKTRRWLETRDEVIDRMARAEDWFFETSHLDRENTLVILLNPYGNSQNYFCGASPERRNVAFIQTTHYATEVTTARHIPVAYELFASALRFRAFNVPDFEQRHVHFQDIGCLNDFFEEISRIQLKIQSANVCDECFDHIMSQDIPQDFIDHVYAGLNAVRELQINFTRARRANRALEVRIENKYVHFGDAGIMVRLPPKQLALYKFFLNHPEGVEYKDFSNHEDELGQLYRECYTGDPDDIDENVANVLEGWFMQSDISTTVSKINKKIKDALRELAHWHTIEGRRGEPKRIKALANS